MHNRKDATFIEVYNQLYPFMTVHIGMRIDRNMHESEKTLNDPDASGSEN